GLVHHVCHEMHAQDTQYVAKRADFGMDAVYAIPAGCVGFDLVVDGIDELDDARPDQLQALVQCALVVIADLQLAVLVAELPASCHVDVVPELDDGGPAARCRVQLVYHVYQLFQDAFIDGILQGSDVLFDQLAGKGNETQEAQGQDRLVVAYGFRIGLDDGASQSPEHADPVVTQQQFEIVQYGTRQLQGLGIFGILVQRRAAAHEQFRLLGQDFQHLVRMFFKPGPEIDVGLFQQGRTGKQDRASASLAKLVDVLADEQEFVAFLEQAVFEQGGQVGNGGKGQFQTQVEASAIQVGLGGQGVVQKL